MKIYIILILLVTSVYAEYSWTRSTIGGGGGEPGLAIDPENDDIAFVGADLGGIIKTTNRGESWTLIQNNLPNLWISDILVDPLDSDIVYVTCVMDLFNAPHNGELYRSEDGGRSWNVLQSQETGSFSIAHLPSSKNIMIPYDASYPGRYDSDSDGVSDIIFIASWGGNYERTNPEGSSGIWKSTDEGRTFRQITLETSNMYFVEQNPNDLNEFYAGTTDKGLYKSTDIGETWSKVSIPGLESDAVSDIAFVNGKDTIYLTVYGKWSDKGGVWKSTDDGSSWEYKAFQFRDDENLVSSILVDREDSTGNTLFLGYRTSYNYWKSTDGAETWTLLPTHQLQSPPAPHWFGNPWGDRVLAMEQGNQGTIYFNSGRSVKVYDRDENMFMIRSTGLGNTVVQDIEFGQDSAYLGISDSTAPFKTINDGQTWELKNNGFNACFGDARIGEVKDIAVSKINPNVLLATGYNKVSGGTTIVKSTDAGETWASVCSGLPYDSSSKFRSVEMSPVNHDIVLLSVDTNTKDSIYRSTNGGNSWSHVTDMKQPYTKIRFTDDGQTVVTGASTEIMISNDAGLTWTEKSLPYNLAVYGIDVCPTNKDIIAAGVNIHGVYLSRDQGDTWELIFDKDDIPELLSQKGYSISEWSKANYKPTTKSVRFGNDCSTIYAGHSPGNPYAGLGLLKTQDSGENWEIITDDSVLGTIYNIDVDNDGSLLIGGLEVGFGKIGSGSSCAEKGGYCCGSGQTCEASTLSSTDCSMCCSQACTTTSTGLIAHWSLDEGSGSVAEGLDGNDAQLENSQWIEGVDGYALEFSGDGSGTAHGEVNPAYLTVSFWIKPNTLGENDGLVAKGDNDNRQFWLWIYEDDLSFEIDEGGYHNNVYSLDTGLWQHIALTYDGTNVIVYVNGQEVNRFSQATGEILSDEDPLVFGLLPGWGYYDGMMDDIRIYDFALSQTEIEELYQQYDACVSLEEIVSALTDWKNNKITTVSVLSLIIEWRNCLHDYG